MKKIFLTYLIFGNLIMFSQNKETEKILEEGKFLYRLEKGSWYGTDDMLERFKDKRDSIGGYLSYETNDNKINTIFFNKYNSDNILVRYQFDSLPKPTPIQIDSINKKASKLERDLIKMRQNALDVVNEDSNNFFKRYEKTSMNFIPIITQNKRQVFILTGSQENGILSLGNDYLLKYNKKNKMSSKEKIHNSIIQFAFKSKNKDNPLVTATHSHVITNYITSTDICSLLLYKNYIEWNQHIVISKKEVSIFNLKNETLFTMKTKAWKKIANAE